MCHVAIEMVPARQRHDRQRPRQTRTDRFLGFILTINAQRALTRQPARRGQDVVIARIFAPPLTHLKREGRPLAGPEQDEPGHTCLQLGRQALVGKRQDVGALRVADQDHRSVRPARLVACQDAPEILGQTLRRAWLPEIA